MNPFSWRDVVSSSFASSYSPLAFWPVSQSPPPPLTHSLSLFFFHFPCATTQGQGLASPTSLVSVRLTAQRSSVLGCLSCQHGLRAIRLNRLALPAPNEGRKKDSVLCSNLFSRRTRLPQRLHPSPVSPFDSDHAAVVPDDELHRVASTYPRVGITETSWIPGY